MSGGVEEGGRGSGNDIWRVREGDRGWQSTKTEDVMLFGKGKRSKHGITKVERGRERGSTRIVEGQYRSGYGVWSGEKGGIWGRESTKTEDLIIFGRERKCAWDNESNEKGRRGEST